jgi:hypothetical protein
MTFVVAAVSGNAIALAADTLVQDGSGQAKYDRKLFIKGGRIGVLTYGCGPLGVPETIDAAQLGTRLLHEEASALGVVFSGVAATHTFGMYVAGFEEQTPALYHVDIPGGTVRLENAASPTGVWFAAPPGCTFIDPWRDPVAANVPLDELVARAVEMVRQGHSIAPESVGSEVESAYIVADGARWTARSPRE